VLKADFSKENEDKRESSLKPCDHGLELRESRRRCRGIVTCRQAGV